MMTIALRQALTVLLVGALAAACGDDGPDSPTDTTSAEVDAGPSCVGSVRACNDRDLQSICEGGDGCRFDPAVCSGSGDGCAEIPDQPACTAAADCAWAPAFCGGIAAPCDTYTARLDCQVAPGCLWE